ncbi:MAG: cytochrome-c oxidase, cbb3-type subunit III [Paracoccaceae bacterium]
MSEQEDNKKASSHQPGDPNTTGHIWDGIEEFDNPMPRWWLWTFYATIFWGVIYTIAYPAWPLVNSATAGVLGWSTRGDVASEIVAAEEANAEINARLAAIRMEDIAEDADLHNYAVSSGAAVFRTWCAQCHGSGAAGAVGYPNLLDDAWLWGGDIENIHLTIAHGIRNEEDPDARYSEMPAFGRDELLTPEEIDKAVNYVMSLSGTPQDASQVEAGSVIFADNCASCHMEDATGDPEQGAPNLADALWLYGGDYDTLTETVTNSRFGVMPSWNNRLTEAQVRAVAAYVHQLGGGE